jgi:hypothetical protein
MSTYNRERYLRNKEAALIANNTLRRKQDDEYKQAVKDYNKENWYKYYSVNKERISLAKKVAYQAKKLLVLQEAYASKYLCEQPNEEDELNRAGF